MMITRTMSVESEIGDQNIGRTERVSAPPSSQPTGWNSTQPSLPAEVAQTQADVLTGGLVSPLGKLIDHIQRRSTDGFD